MGMLGSVAAAAKSLFMGTNALTKGTGYLGTTAHSAALGAAFGGARGALSGDQTMFGGAFQGAKAGAMWGLGGRAITHGLAGRKFGMTRSPSYLMNNVKRGTAGGASFMQGSYRSPIAKKYQGYGLRINAGGISGQRIDSNTRTVIGARISSLTGLAAGLFGSSNKSKNRATINANRINMGSTGMGQFR